MFAFKRELLFWMMAVVLTSAVTQQAAAQPAEGESTPASRPNGTPLTLEQAVATALEKNLSLQAARQSTRSSQWGLKKAYLDYLPQVSFGFQYLRLDQGTLDRANAFYNFVNDPANSQFLPEELRRNVRPGAWRNSYGPSVSVVQPIFTGGVLSSQLNLARALDSRGQASLEETRQRVIFDTHNAYFQVLKAQELLALAEESRRSAQRHLETSKKMLEVGLRARTEVLRFEVALASAENAVVVAQNNLELAKSALNQVMGVALEQEVTLQPVNDFSWQAPRTLAEQTEIALRRHPGVQMMKANVAAQRAAVGVARSGFLPKVGLAYNYSWEANDTWAFDSFRTWSLAISASLPVFNSFQNYAGLQRERSALQQAQKMEEDFIRGLQLQVKQASLNLAAAEKRITIAEKAVEEANENLRIVNNSYEVGLLSSLDVVDAEVAATQAKASRIEARYDFFLAKAQLARAMGVLGR
ncbi:MAG: TolC family protein [candidate division KSB1 bacterium]|nr:TolC family protein [candidate division KSB1 bacterium]MDZ7274375.1 TolC family protein [candidate division KSB1 bacterium]MDZ7284963.1 TolC family protein [candidate division KSB1 bacterium]MDZ7297616.1 TolC family protein [candidate division KSB1 bacterium]MDZ7306356.1 TolC family protein [candidate division KSB1 bacterium]